MPLSSLDSQSYSRISSLCACAHVPFVYKPPVIILSRTSNHPRHRVRICNAQLKEEKCVTHHLRPRLLDLLRYCRSIVDDTCYEALVLNQLRHASSKRPQTLQICLLLPSSQDSLPRSSSPLSALHFLTA